MDFELTPEQQEMRDVARDFAEREVAPVIRRFDESQQFPHEIVAKLAGTGLMGALVPEEYGGAALDYVSYALAVEELNRVDASVGITMWAHNSLCTNHIARFGSPEQKAAYLPRLARGEALGAWALTEPGSGSDAAAMRSRAVPDGDHFVLNGSKAFITNASGGGIAVVMARPTRPRQQGDLGLHPRAGDAGVQRRASPTGSSACTPRTPPSCILEHVRVPPTDLLRRARRGLRQHHAGARGRAHRDGRDGGGHRPGRARPGRSST